MNYKGIIGGNDGNDIDSLLLEFFVLFDVGWEMFHLAARGKSSWHREQNDPFTLEFLWDVSHSCLQGDCELSGHRRVEGLRRQ